MLLADDVEKPPHITIPKPYSLVTPHRRLGKPFSGKADRQTVQRVADSLLKRAASLTLKVKNALKCLAEIFFFSNNPYFFPQEVD